MIRSSTTVVLRYFQSLVTRNYWKIIVFRQKTYSSEHFFFHAHLKTSWTILVINDPKRPLPPLYHPTSFSCQQMIFLWLVYSFAYVSVFFVVQHVWYKVIKCSGFIQCSFALPWWTQRKICGGLKSLTEITHWHRDVSTQPGTKSKEEKVSMIWHRSHRLFPVELTEKAQRMCNWHAEMKLSWGWVWCTLHSLPTPPSYDDGTPLMASQIDSSAPDGSVW